MLKILYIQYIQIFSPYWKKKKPLQINLYYLLFTFIHFCYYFYKTEVITQNNYDYFFELNTEMYI